MKLPIIDTYTFPVTLPSSNALVTARPFLVREEKLMFMAQESKDSFEQIEAIAQIIRNCTNGQVEPKTAPYFDVEYLLLQLRARSVGEVISLTYQCNSSKEVDGSLQKCGHKTPININLLETHVPFSEENHSLRSFDINSTFSMKLRYPTIYTISKFLETQKNDPLTTIETPLNQLTDLFDTLQNKNTNETFNFDNYSLEEKVEFFNNMSPASFEKILSFWQKLPIIKHTTSYTCQECGTPHSLTFNGIMDFLE